MFTDLPVLAGSSRPSLNRQVGIYDEEIETIHHQAGRDWWAGAAESKPDTSY